MEKTYERLKLSFLLENCPAHHDNPEDCPLNSIRGMSVEEKHKWLESLTDEELSGILTEHESCYNNKLS